MSHPHDTAAHTPKSDPFETTRFGELIAIAIGGWIVGFVILCWFSGFENLTIHCKLSIKSAHKKTPLESGADVSRCWQASRHSCDCTHPNEEPPNVLSKIHDRILLSKSPALCKPPNEFVRH